MTDDGGESVHEVIDETRESLDRVEETMDEGHERLLSKLDELAGGD